MRIGSIILAAAIAASVGYWLYTGAQKSNAATSGAAEDRAKEVAAAGKRAVAAIKPVTVLIVDSEAQDLANQVTLRGLTEAARKVDVRAQTSGLVLSTPRKKGSKVEKGQLLCEIEAGDRKAALAEAEASLAKAQSDAAASAELKRRGFSSKADVVADQARLGSAKAQIARIKLDIQRTKMTAPFQGVLETDAAETGTLLQTGGVCATIIALDPIKVVGFAPERVVNELAAGQRGEARLITGERFSAEVSFVSRSADTETRTFKVEATAPNPSGIYRDGMTAELSLRLADDRAHILPGSALTLNNEGALGVRIALENTNSPTGVSAQFMPIKIVRDDASGIWVTGLPDSASVIVVGQEFVLDGSPVTPMRQ